MAQYSSVFTAPSFPTHRILSRVVQHASMLAGLMLDALFPDSCLACLAPREDGARHALACDACLGSCALPNAVSCGRCGQDSLTLPPACHPHSPSRLTLAAREQRVIGTLASALRFGHMHRAADPLADLLATSAIACGMPLHRTHVAPIPEPAFVIRERGYAANELLARSFARNLGLMLAPSLLTVSGTDLPAYGIGDAGESASARTVILVSVATLPRVAASHCAELVRGACFSPTISLLACTA